MLMTMHGDDDHVCMRHLMSALPLLCRYILHCTGEAELYDLASDPGELDNLLAPSVQAGGTMGGSAREDTAEDGSASADTEEPGAAAVVAAAAAVAGALVDREEAAGAVRFAAVNAMKDKLPSMLRWSRHRWRESLGGRVILTQRQKKAQERRGVSDQQFASKHRRKVSGQEKHSADTHAVQEGTEALGEPLHSPMTHGSGGDDVEDEGGKGQCGKGAALEQHEVQKGNGSSNGSGSDGARGSASSGSHGGISGSAAMRDLSLKLGSLPSEVLVCLRSRLDTLLALLAVCRGWACSYPYQVSCSNCDHAALAAAPASPGGQLVH